METPQFECRRCGGEIPYRPRLEDALGKIHWCRSCRSNVCRLCDNESERLEFHHASYIYDIGLSVCKDCHNRIHHEDGFHDHLEPEITRSTAQEWDLDCTLME